MGAARSSAHSWLGILSLNRPEGAERFHNKLGSPW